MKNKKFLILVMLAILIVLNILIFILLYLYKAENININDLYISTTEKTEVTSYEYDGKLYPEDNYEFEQKYNGRKNTDDIYKSIYNFVNNLYNLYDKTAKLETKEEFKQYYNNNKNDLKYKYMIVSTDNLMNIATQLRKIYNDNTNYYKTVKFMSDTYNKTDKNIECNLLIVFKDNQQLEVKIIIPNSGETIYFSTIED